MFSVNSSFICNDAGDVSILFDDANFVRAETILFHESTGEVHALLNNMQMQIGHMSGVLIEAFANQNTVVLTSKRTDGSVFDLEAKLVIVN